MALLSENVPCMRHAWHSSTFVPSQRDPMTQYQVPKTDYNCHRKYLEDDKYQKPNQTPEKKRNRTSGDPVKLECVERVSSAFGAFPSIHLTHNSRGGRPQKNPLRCLPAENERKNEGSKKGR